MNNAFLARKTGKGSNYNYELMPLINNFTFYIVCSCCNCCVVFNSFHFEKRSCQFL